MLASGVTIAAVGGSTLIDFGTGRPDVTLTGVAPGAIAGADFIF
jgi:hypothetical protein